MYGVHFRHILLILLLGHSLVFGQVRPFINVDVNEIENLNSDEINFLRKSSLEIILATSSFDILLNENNEFSTKGVESFVLKLRTKKLDSGKFTLDFRLESNKSKKIVAQRKISNVFPEKVQLEGRKLLYKLFYGENYDAKKDRINKNELDSNISEAISSNNINNNDLNESAESKKKALAAIELQDKIDALKKEKSLLENNKSKKVRKAQANTATVNNFDSPNLDLTLNNTKGKKASTKITLIPDSFYAIGYLKETTLSNNVVDSAATLDTQTNLTSLNLTYLNNIKIEEWEEYFSLGGAFSYLLSENPYGISPRFSLYGSYNRSLFSNTLFGSLDMEYEQISFVNISNRGSGLEGFSNNVFWVGVGAKYIDEIGGKKVVFSGFYKQALVGSSDLSSTGESVVVSGNKITLDTSVNILGKLGLGLFYELASFTSVNDNDFATEHQVIGLRAVYN